MASEVRWGILGTANIAQYAFLPALREAGGGMAHAIAGRELDRAERFAREHEVGSAVAGYQRLLEDPEIHAVYIPLPNALHAEWTIAALRQEKAVLCEKPLSSTVEETERVLEVARSTRGLLWEAFVFPFHAQIARVRRMLEDGFIGELREIQSSFHFLMTGEEDIRYSRELAGGSLQDVGCYPIRLARLLFEGESGDGWAAAVYGDSGVDVEMWGFLDFPDERELLFSCGFQRKYDTFTRLMGTSGSIHLTNPFHPEASDAIEVLSGGERTLERATQDQNSFTAAIRHIHGVLRGDEEPQHLAIDEALGNARSIALLARRSGGEATHGGSPSARDPDARW